MSLLFTGNNINSPSQNLISTVQIVDTWVLNLSSKFQLNRTTDEVDLLVDEIWTNAFFLSLFSSLCFFFLDFFFSFVFFNVTNLVPKHMGPTPSHTREPNKSPPPNYVRGSTKPACFLQNCSFFIGIGFVIISNPFSSIWIFSRKNNFISSASRIQ